MQIHNIILIFKYSVISEIVHNCNHLMRGSVLVIVENEFTLFQFHLRSFSLEHTNHILRFQTISFTALVKAKLELLLNMTVHNTYWFM